MRSLGHRVGGIAKCTTSDPVPWSVKHHQQPLRFGAHLRRMQRKEMGHKDLSSD